MNRIICILIVFPMILTQATCLRASEKDRGGAPGAAGQHDWSQWRGPARDGVSLERGLLQEWPEDGPRRVWLFERAGKGYGGPAIVGGRLFIMGTDVDQNRELLFCFNADTGEQLWTTPIGDVLKNSWGDGPRSTPTVDGDRVYVLGGQGVLMCVEASGGKRLWTKDLVADFKGRKPNWGYTESVLIDGDRLICSPGGEEAAVVALDKKSGKMIWKCGDIDMRVHYSSIIRIDSPATYVRLTMTEVAGLDVENGEVRWRVEFPGRTAVVPTPVYKDGHLFITAGYGVGCKLIKLAGGKAEEIYFNKNMKNHHGGVLELDGRIYGYSDGVGWSCLEMASGDIVWKEKRALSKGSVTFADGRLYCLGEKRGTVVLASATPDGWKEHGRFELQPKSKIRSPRGRIWTHPVVCNGKLYLRDQEYIYCYDVSAP